MKFKNNELLSIAKQPYQSSFAHSAGHLVVWTSDTVDRTVSIQRTRNPLSARISPGIIVEFARLVPDSQLE